MEDLNGFLVDGGALVQKANRLTVSSGFNRLKCTKSKSLNVYSSKYLNLNEIYHIFNMASINAPPQTCGCHLPSFTHFSVEKFSLYHTSAKTVLCLCRANGFKFGFKIF